MKRKVLLGFVSAALAAAMCVGFVGCGEVDSKSVKGEEVTEKQWNSALDYFSQDDAVYTIKYREEQIADEKCVYLDEKLSGTTTNVTTIDAINNGARAYVKSTQKTEISGDMKKIAAAYDTEVEIVDETEEAYAEFGEDSYTVYTLDDDDQWVTNERSSSIIPFNKLIAGISLSYSSYEYSADLKGYVLKDALKLGTIFVVKFNGDGKLSAIYYDYERSTKSGNLERKSGYTLNVIIEYEADEITLPTVEQN